MDLCVLSLIVRITFCIMAQEEAIKLFEDKQVRYIWDDEKEKYFFSVVDVIQVLTESNIPKRYWSDLKRKLAAEGNETYENIVRLKMTAPDLSRSNCGWHTLDKSD